MQLTDVREALAIARALGLSVLLVLVIALMGGACLPVTGQVIADIALWLAAAVVAATYYARTARAARIAVDEAQDRVELLGDISHELLALLGGAFFGPWLAVAAFKELQETSGGGPNTVYLAGAALVGLAALGYAMRKLVRYREILHAARVV